MKAVHLLKSESDYIMKTNMKLKTNFEVVTETTNKFTELKTLLVSNAKNFNEGLSLKAQLLIQSCLITIDENLSIHKCIVNPDKDNTISSEQLELWIESIYNSGLKPLYNKLAWKEFKKSDSEFYLEFKLLKEIASAVQFMCSRYFNGSSKLEQLPLCKVDIIKNSPTAIVPTANSGEFMINNKVYLRFDFLNSLDAKIKKAVLTTDNGFYSQLIKNIESNKTKFEEFTVNQIIDIANTVVNYRFIEKKKSGTRDDNIKDMIADFQTEVQKNTTKDEKSGEIVRNNDTHTMTNKRWIEFNSLVEVIISDSLERKSYSYVLNLLKTINETVLVNKEFRQFLDSEKFVFVAKPYADGGLYNSVKDYLSKH